MNRYLVSSPGNNDLFIHNSSLKGVCVADDTILKTLTVADGGDITLGEYIEVPNEMYCVDGHQESGRVIFAGDGNQAYTSNVSDLNQNSVFCEYIGKIWDIALDKSGVRACLVGDDKNPVLFNFDLKKRLTFEATVPCALISCAWSPDTTTFAVVGRNGHLTLYWVDQDFTEIKLIQQWKITEKDIKEDYLHGYNARFVDENTLIVSGKDCLQVITKKGETWHYSISSKIKHQGLIYHVAVLRNNFIVTVGQDKKIYVWNLGVELKLKTFEQTYQVVRVQFVASQDILVLMDNQGQIFTSSDCIRVGHIVPPTEDTRVSTEESRRETIPEEDNSNVQPSTVGNKMDEERQIQVNRIPLEESNSNYRPEIEDEGTRLENQMTHKNKRLVYDEAEEADMRRTAGIIEDTESRFDRSNRKVARQRREENAPQPEFIPGSTTGSGEGRNRRHFLAYNMCGRVMARQYDAKKAGLVEAEFSLGSLSRQSIVNNRGFHMAALNYRGLLLGSAGEVIREDEYVDEEKNEDETVSVIRFLAPDFKKTWEVTFDKNENAQSIALGLHCAAVFTNRQLIRIFSPDGIEMQVFGFARPVVGMALYENLLAIVYHGSSPFSGSQILRLQMVNLSNREVVEDRDLVLSPDSRLKWYGFSEEGIFYVQDTKFVLWGQQTTSLWAPVFDGAKEANMWVIGVSEQTIIYLRLPPGEMEPCALVNYTPSNISFRPPFIQEENKARFLELLKLDQARLRVSHFGHMRAGAIFEGANEDPMTLSRQTLPGDEEMERLAVEIDRLTLDRARLALLKGDVEAAIYYGLQLESSKTLAVCLRLFESLGHARTAERLKLEADKLGNVQFRLRQGPARQYVPQIVLQTATAERAEESDRLLVFNSLKINTASSFADLVDDRPAKHKAADSAKEDDRPKQKATTNHDLFRDLSEMAKAKR